MELRIAQLANFVGPTSGGMKIAIDQLARGYRAGGAQRLLVVPGSTDDWIETELGWVVTVAAPTVSGGYRMIVDPRPVLRALEAFGPTSLEVSDKTTLLAVTVAAKRRGIPTVLFSHERLDAMLSLRVGLGTGLSRSLRHPLRWFNGRLARVYDEIVVTSAYAAGEFSGLAAVDATRLHRVPLGVDLETFAPLDEAVRADIPRDGLLRLVHAGRLSREKEPHLSLKVLRALHRRGVPVHLDVYGEGPMRGELEALAAGLPVIFHGHVAGRGAIARRLGEADVSLSLCAGETFGLAVLEALACGTPVVTADRGGARELVDDTSGGWAAADDPEALADAVLRVAERPEAQRRLAARARAERYPWAAPVERMLALHRELATRPRD
ncbi:glycosyltransferase [Arsenicicoccus dermatophilus]|uniref:glycosyltransferase n=1 Tax=Arsenicicoccus dermatophilus TaxID=1076331 RepID=UPI0039172A37